MHPLVEKILQGDPRALARLLRSIDDRAGTYLQALTELYPHTGRARVIGITGNPGAGKSTPREETSAGSLARPRTRSARSTRGART